METVTVPKGKLSKVLADVEALIEDVSDLFDQDETVTNRLAEVRADPSIGGSEEELDSYLKRRDVHID